MFYTDTHPNGGPARTLVLVHGFPHTHELWDADAKVFSKETRVITYDLRGFGETPVGDGNLLIDFFVEDLIALLDQLHLAKVTLGGLSMGGYIVLRAVELHPNRFERLILADTGADPDPNAGKLKRTQFIRKIRDDGFEKFIESYSEGVLMPETLARDPQILGRFQTMIRKNSPQSVSRGFIALAARMDMNESLAKIAAPTLILVGSRDTVTPLALSERMHTQIRNSRMHVIPGAGHLSNWDQPEAFQSRVLDFLREPF